MRIFPIKCVLLGNSTVGKTSILRSFFYGSTDDNETSADNYLMGQGDLGFFS